MLKSVILKNFYVFTFILVLILSLFLNNTFLAINSIFLKMLKQVLQESFFSTFVSSIPVNLNQYRETEWVCSITATLLSVIFVIYGTANHFETVVLLSLLMQFSYVQLIYLLSESVQSLHF